MHAAQRVCIYVSVYVSEKPVESYCAPRYSVYVFVFEWYIALAAEFQGLVLREHPQSLFASDTPENDGDDTLIMTWL